MQQQQCNLVACSSTNSLLYCPQPQTVPPHQVEPVSESRLGLVAVLPTGVEWSIPGPPSVLVYSDTSGSFSCGAVVPNGAWFNAQ